MPLFVFKSKVPAYHPAFGGVGFTRDSRFGYPAPFATWYRPLHTWSCASHLLGEQQEYCDGIHCNSV